MIKALIVDDELAPREVLHELIKDFCPEVEVVGIAKDTFEAEALIEQTQPDLVFLDVEMPKRSGIEFLQQQKDISYDVVFTTAFEHYAIDAIKLSALDYLVKPIDIKELINTVHRVSKEKGRKERISNFIGNTESSVQKIALCQADGVDFVAIHDIVYCQAEGSYTLFVIAGTKPIMVSKTLKYYEDILLEHDFFRCHKSYLVNLNAIKRFDKEAYLELSNGERIITSRRKKDELIQLITKISS